MAYHQVPEQKIPKKELYPNRKITLISNGESLVNGSVFFWGSHYDEMIRIGYNSVLVQDENFCLLVNVSPPSEAQLASDFPFWKTMREPPNGYFKRPPQGALTQALSGLGVRPEDITDIVVTPFQIYCTAGLLCFPNARYHFSKRGWMHLHVTKEHPHDERWRSFDRNTLGELVVNSWNRVHLLEDEDEILPGIRTWWSGGHHRESIVVEIDSAIGTVSVSDTFFCEQNVTRNIPIGLSENIYESLAAYKRLRKTADYLVSVHDPEIFGIADKGIVEIL